MLNNSLACDSTEHCKNNSSATCVPIEKNCTINENVKYVRCVVVWSKDDNGMRNVKKFCYRYANSYPDCEHEVSKR